MAAPVALLLALLARAASVPVKDVSELYKNVNLSMHLPGGHDKPFSAGYLMPVAALVTEDMHLRYISNDTRCNEGWAMNNVIDVYIHQSPTAIIGPICDYAAAPVARQTAFWNLAMLTVGAFARDFKLYKRTVYKTLTRAGPINFADLGTFITHFLSDNHFRRFQLVYDVNGFNDITPKFCHLLSVALVYDIEDGQHHRNVSLSFYRLTPNVPFDKVEKDMKEEFSKFGLNTAGKSLSKA